jgi:hypothetical protein
MDEGEQKNQPGLFTFKNQADKTLQQRLPPSTQLFAGSRQSLKGVLITFDGYSICLHGFLSVYAVLTTYSLAQV